MRLFLALDLPQAARAAAAKAMAGLKGCGAKVKWVQPQNLHLTLKFLGETHEGLLEAIKQGHERACSGMTAFELGLRGCGAFPRQRRPQVVWLGISGQVEGLAQLAARLEAKMEPLGFAPEKRPFRSHLTLGRLKRGKRGKKKAPVPAELTRAMADMADWRGPGFLARDVVLMKSTLTPSGAVYEPLQTITLPTG